MNMDNENNKKEEKEHNETKSLNDLVMDNLLTSLKSSNSILNSLENSNRIYDSVFKKITPSLIEIGRINNTINNSVSDLVNSLNFNYSPLYSIGKQHEIISNVILEGNKLPSITSNLNNFSALKEANRSILTFNSNYRSALEEASRSMLTSNLNYYSTLEEARKSIVNLMNNIDWFSLNERITYLTSSVLENFYLNHDDKISFAGELEKIIGECPKDIKNIFHVRFLNNLIISENLWILPRLTKNEYFELSEIDFGNDKISSYLFDDYFMNDDKIINMIKSWNITNSRKKIMNQILKNYIDEQYETVIIMLTTQIDGILIDNLDTEEIYENKKRTWIKSGKLRKILEKKIKKSSENTDDSWNLFIKKANIKFISHILKPLYAEKDFVNDDEINRNLMLHKGTINLDKEPQSNQLIAIRFFLIIDTILFMFEDLDSSF